MALALYHNFVEDKNLTDRVTGSALTCTRASVATVRNRDGLLETVSSHTARFEHDINGECLGLLSEAAAVNICLQSENLATTWTNSQSVDAQTQGTAPDGSRSANKLTDDSGGGTGVCAVSQSVTVGTATRYSASAFLKADQLDWGAIVISGQGALNIFAYFDLTNGAVGATLGSDNVAAYIKEYKNGWYKCSVVFDSDAADTTGSFDIRIAEADNDSVVARDGTSSILVWGAQLEANDFPTSYIKTTTTATQRFRDSVSGATSGFYNQLGGTFYVKATLDNLSISGTRVALSFDDTSTTDRINLYADGGEDASLFMASSNVSQASMGSASQGEFKNAPFIAVARCLVDDVEYWANGALVGTDTSATMPIGIDRYAPGERNGGETFEGCVKEIAYYDTGLDSDDLRMLSAGDRTIQGVIDRKRRQHFRRKKAARSGRDRRWVGRRLR
jgi:hypothetical protein